jgi:hexosaminidase
MERPAEKHIFIHKAAGRTARYETHPNYRYPSLTPNPLTDGLRGSDRYNDGYWQGFHGDDLDITIDLGKVDTVHQVSSGFLQQQWGWIFLPVKVTVALSEDQQNWKEIEINNTVPPQAEGVIVKDFVVNAEGFPARYIRVHAVNPGICPEWHPGAGDQAWIFADEIIVN